MTINRLGTTQRWSDSVSHNGVVYIVEVPSTLTADITAQAQEMLASLEQLLHKAGSDKTRILMATIYLADIRTIDAFNAVWDSWVPAGTAPARACVEAKLANPGYKVEIQVIAATC
jgi:enamine deaminase RidA (YjgF/YER057c/UK114 family)